MRLSVETGYLWGGNETLQWAILLGCAWVLVPGLRTERNEHRDLGAMRTFDTYRMLLMKVEMQRLLMPRCLAAKEGIKSALIAKETLDSTDQCLWYLPAL